jgi:hypothetical protein
MVGSHMPATISASSSSGHVIHDPGLWEHDDGGWLYLSDAQWERLAPLLPKALLD